MFAGSCFESEDLAPRVRRLHETDQLIHEYKILEMLPQHCGYFDCIGEYTECTYRRTLLIVDSRYSHTGIVHCSMALLS